MKCEKCNCECKKEKDAYLHSIKIMFSHLGINSTRQEKSLIKGIEKEILVVSGFSKTGENKDKSHHYYDTDRNKEPKFQ